jgi:branched-chain amino acid transport system ATP-binding protein
MSLLSVSDVRKTFGGIVALDGVSVDVEEGTTHAIIGSNGAGKTTLFNCITGFYRPDSGSIVFDGEEIVGEKPQDVARKGIRRTFQEVDVFDELTVAENISLASYTTDPYEIMSILDLLEINDRYADELTLFERKRVALALAMDGQLLLLDEIFSGLNPSEKPVMMEYIRTIGEDKTLVLIEHDLETAFDLAEELVVLHQGEVLGKGAPEEITSDVEIREKYLGERTI